jgi:hypothetical protein
MKTLRVLGVALWAAAVSCGFTLEAGEPHLASRFDTQTDPSHCGALGNVCRAAHARAICSEGRCAIAACEDGWADCDGSDATGCETPIAADPATCGACQRACDLPHAVADCLAGECVIAGCLPGFLDCDGIASNGCETSTATSLRDCGACGAACREGEVCAAGACSDDCPSPLARCGALCVDRAFDPAHCGACGRACRLDHAATACEAGECRVARCQGGFGDCDAASENGCETETSRDPDHCGACGRACHLDHAVAACRSGTCRLVGCQAGWDDCDGAEANGCETDTQGSAANCGACGFACGLENATARCADGACALDACGPGFGDCDGAAGNGCETDILTDPRHCGACHHRCPGGESCVDGDCAGECPPPHVACRRACVHLDRDPAHCGACGAACRLEHASSACVAGSCQVKRCQEGWGDCDGDPANGCEASLRVGPDCGACGHSCPRGYRCVLGPARLAACAYWPEPG